jgi:hypothetical protein
LRTMQIFRRRGRALHKAAGPLPTRHWLAFRSCFGPSASLAESA